MARLGLVLIALVTASCGYTLAGRGNSLPDHIRRIGLPGFENQSQTPELDRILTDAVRQELQNKGRYVIVQDTTGVDAVLTGIVRPVSVNVAALTPGRQAQRYLLTIQASVEFKDLKDNKVLWSNPNLRATEEYDATSTTTTGDPAAIFSQDQNAMTRLARTFARTLVTSIMEAF